MSYNDFASMSSGELFSVIISSLFITLLLYLSFPLAFAAIRSKNISTKKYRNLCIWITVGIALVYSLLSSANGGGFTSGAPAFLWGTIGYQTGKKMLRSKGLLDGIPFGSDTETPLAQGSAPDICDISDNAVSKLDCTINNVESPIEVCSNQGDVIQKVRFCRKCGRELKEGSIFCSFCGTKIGGDDL